MGKEYKLPDALFAARNPVTITGHQKTKDGLRLTLQCGHHVDTVNRAPPPEGARIACPLCHPVFDRHQTYLRKG